MINFLKKFIIMVLFLGFFSVFFTSFAQTTINLNGQELLPKAEIFISPRTGNFIAGSTFEAPVYIDTKGNNINAINLKVRFNPSKMAVVKPSGSKSIFGIWVEPPSYDNAKGTVSLVGLIPDGIVTSSGLITTITFKSLASGEASVYITEESSANLNDGLGSNVKLSLGKSFYTFSPKMPEGVIISSDTHPFEDNWYNNNSPVLRWEKTPEISGYSILLDNNPNTIPPTTITTNESSISYENLKDGVWYFHVRNNNKGIWGNSSHFQIKIDTKPPALFKPEVNTLKDIYGNKKYSISFLTTDSLSSIDHYEVGSIHEENKEEISSPVFIQSESPYLVQGTNTEVIRVIIRAFDNAGNIQEAYVDLFPGFTILQNLKKYGSYVLIFIIFILFLELVIHYIFGHHILGHIKRAYKFFKKISSNENFSEDIKNIPKNKEEKRPLPEEILYFKNNQIKNPIEKTYSVKDNQIQIPKEEQESE
jgi:hypothetical protein